MAFRRNKYRAQPVEIDGHRFASTAEARRYTELKALLAAGEITDLELQPAFHIVIDGRPVRIPSKGYPNGRAVRYLADFRYRTRDGRVVVEDVKGMDTDVSKLKRALVEAIHQVKVEVIKYG